MPGAVAAIRGHLTLAGACPHPAAAAQAYIDIGPSALPWLQLHPCADGALSQRWTFGGNGSIYSLDHTGTLGYCLDIRANGTKAGQQVFASNCGPSRADPYGPWA